MFPIKDCGKRAEIRSGVNSFLLFADKLIKLDFRLACGGFEEQKKQASIRWKQLYSSGINLCVCTSNGTYGW